MYTQEEKEIIIRILSKISKGLKNKTRPFFGICTEIGYYISNTNEYLLVRSYMDHNITFKGKLRWIFMYSSFWWKKGRRKPRLRWIKRQIKKLS